MSFQQLHSDEGSLLTFVDFINRANVGMVESGCRTSLATKTFQGLGIVSYFFRQELQSHESAKARVLGFVDNTHAAAAELLNDAVVRDGLADHAQACYGGSLGKSMKAMEFAASQKSCWRNIAISPTTPSCPSLGLRKLNSCRLVSAVQSGALREGTA